MTEAALHAAIGRLSVELQTALDRFAANSRIADLATSEVPNARVRLEHVLKLTDAAAHRTLELVEQSIPQLDTVLGSGGDLRVGECLQRVRANLTEVLLAQSYQDLSGQIIRNVIALVGEIESVLRELVRLGGQEGVAPPPAAQAATAAQPTGSGYGPAVAGIAHDDAVAAQTDVDSLLTGLGI